LVNIKNPIRVIRTQSRIVVGGPAKHTILLSKELNNKYFQTVLVGGASKTIEKSLVENARDKGVKCYVIPEMAREIHFYDDIVSTIKLYNLIKKEKPLIFHSHTAKAGGIGRIAAYLAGVPLIFHTFHGHVFEGYFGKIKTRIFILIEKLLARISTKVIVISEQQKKDIVKKYNITKNDRVELIRLGFDWKRDFFKSSGIKIRDEYQIPKKKYLIGIIGRLVPIKDHKLFIDIAEKIISENKNDYHFIIIGDGELKHDLVKLVYQKKLDEYITFTGWINVSNEIYNELDLLLLTSLNEGTPVTVIESIAAGTPVIAIDVGGVADVMKFYDTKYLVKERSSEKFIELIKYIKINSEQPSDKMQSNIQAIFSNQKLVTVITKLYRNSLKKLFSKSG
jgi:glycosyltransferase involved in cell wall biosynthesis